MALQPDLEGTITLTSGSTAFTWSGPSLQTAPVKAGEKIYLPLKGLMLKIASVTSATQGTLTNNCPAAAAGSGQVARIEFQSDLSRAPALLQQIVGMLGGGTVPALAGLDGTGGNKGVLLTGPGTAETFPLTPFGRALAGLTGANGRIPVATAAGTAAMRDLVGTVAQSGGIPTGALFERGSNANGHYFRTAGGLQVCLREITHDLTTTGVTTVSFAAAFNPTNLIVPFWGPSSGFVSGDIAALGNGINDVTGSGWRFRIAGGGGLSTAAIINLGAIGFWHT